MFFFQGLITNKPSKFISLYCSPSLPTDNFDDFPNNPELTLKEVAKNNPFLTVICKLLVCSYATCFFSETFVFYNILHKPTI